MHELDEVKLNREKAHVQREMKFKVKERKGKKKEKNCDWNPLPRRKKKNKKGERKE